MRTYATAAAMATVLAMPAAAKTLLKNPQRLIPDYVSATSLKTFQNRNVVIEAGRVLGRDPDANIRLELLRDYGDW